jgi:hypothetical protein
MRRFEVRCREMLRRGEFARSEGLGADGRIETKTGGCVVVLMR